MDKMARNGKRDLRQKNAKETEKTDLQNGSEISADVWGECCIMRNKEEDLMRRTEMQMLRWIVGVSKKEKVRNIKIKRRCVEDIVENIREARLRRFGHVARRDEGKQ